ncbi:Hypothetical predicted protein [Pelobates cultripes]|uniref:Uncharacterized protein n=1 Tax=Pelobates cultripes TaxID=61616 RepID=A0AAD1RLQ8_PELCU|nr:Hypothetical predicted protein [Pelobates cultripes]
MQARQGSPKSHRAVNFASTHTNNAGEDMDQMLATRMEQILQRCFDLCWKKRRFGNGYCKISRGGTDPDYIEEDYGIFKGLCLLYHADGGVTDVAAVLVDGYVSQ